MKSFTQKSNTVERIWGWFAPSRQLKSILQDNIRVASPLAEAVVEIGDVAEKKKKKGL